MRFKIVRKQPPVGNFFPLKEHKAITKKKLYKKTTIIFAIVSIIELILLLKSYL